MPGTTEVRRLDLASLASVRAFAAGWDGEIDLLINNAGVMIPPLTPHRRRLRAAVRHQPPRPLRADQPAARARHRPRRHGLLDRRTASGAIDFDDLNWERRPYKRVARLRAVQAGQPAVHRRAAAPADRGRLDASWRPPRTPATPPPTSSSTAAAGRSDAVQRVGNRLLAQDEDGGALPTLYAAVADVPGDSFAGPGRLHGAARRAQARRADRRREGRRTWPPAVGRLRAAHRTSLPAGDGSAAARRQRPAAGRRSVRPPPTRPGPSRAPRSTPRWPALEVELAGTRASSVGRRRRVQPQPGERVVAVVLELDDVGGDAVTRSREAEHELLGPQQQAARGRRRRVPPSAGSGSSRARSGRPRR